MILREINNKYVTDRIANGFIIGEELSQELDSATIIIPMSSKLDIKEYDVVEIKFGYALNNNVVSVIDNNLKSVYYCVASVKEAYATFQEPYKYTYTVNLMSLTKLLETMPLPSMAVTNIGQNRTIGYYLDKVCKYYFNYDGLTITNINIPSKVSEMICPELTLTKPTLREYCDYLLSVGGYRAMISFNGSSFELTAQDINLKLGEIPRNLIQSIETNRNANSYVTNLVSDIDSAIGQDVITEYRALSSDEYALTTNNAKIILSHNIYDVEQLEVVNLPIRFVAGDLQMFTSQTGYYASDKLESVVSSEAVNYTLNIPLKNWLFTREVFESLQLLPAGQFAVRVNCNDSLKNSALYYERNKNSIEHLLWTNSGVSGIFKVTDKTPLELAILSYITKEQQTILDNLKEFKNGVYSWYEIRTIAGVTLPNFKDYAFKISYKPYVSSKLDIQQTTSFEHNVAMTNNSTDSLVNLDTFAKQSLDNVNLLGNPELIMLANAKRGNNEFDNINAIQVGMTFDDYVVMKLEKRIQADRILFKGILSKYFPNKNVYTALDRTKRYTSLQNSDVVERHEIKKIDVYCRLDGNNTVYNNLINKQGSYAGFSATMEDGSSKYGFMIPTLVRAANTLVYTVKFENNNVFGTVRQSTVNNNKTDEYTLLEPLTYVDNKGEFVSIHLDIYEKPDNTNYNEFVKLFPKHTLKTLGANQIGYARYDILKDAREKLKLSIEYNFVSDNENIIIGKAFSDIFDPTKIKYVLERRGQYNDVVSQLEINNFVDSFNRFTNGMSFSVSGDMEIVNSNGEMVMCIYNYNENEIRF